MDTIDRETIVDLLNADHRIAVSLYMPAHTDEGAQIRQDPIRFKNLLGEAEQQLKALDADSREIEALLAPARARLDDPEFWQEGGDGLACFIAPGFFQHYRVSQPLPEKVTVDTRFSVRALVPELGRSGRYYVLALSENHNWLILVEHGRHTVLDMPGAPASLNDYMKLEDREEQLQMHSSGSPQSGDSAGVFHGGGSWHDYEHAQLPLYLKAINNVLETMLATDRAPLVLAGVEEIVSDFRNICTYESLVPQPLFGNYDEEQPGRLASLVLPIVEPYLGADGRSKTERLRELLGTSQATGDPAQIVRDAVNGRVDALFIDPQAEVWGVFEAVNQDVALHEQRQDASDDLVELAVRETLRNAGMVIALNRDEIPSGASMAALLRWA
jgi:hypothetical protein